VFPDFHRIGVGHVGSQKRAAFPPPCHPQCLAVRPVGEGGGLGFAFAMKGDVHFDVASVATGFLLRGSDGLVEFVAFERALAGGETREGFEVVARGGGDAWIVLWRYNPRFGQGCKSRRRGRGVSLSRCAGRCAMASRAGIAPAWCSLPSLRRFLQRRNMWGLHHGSMVWRNRVGRHYKHFGRPNLVRSGVPARFAAENR